MKVIEDRYSRKLDNEIQEINGLGGAGGTIERRLDLVNFGMGEIERAENEMLIFKEANLEYDILSVINYDYRLSGYANRFYQQAVKVIGFISINSGSDVVKLIPMAKKELMLKLMKRMVEIAARWDIERMINVYEFNTQPEYRAFPKRKPLLDECIFFANRMNATKMGIVFEDKIMPRKIIFAVEPSSGKSFVANIYSLMSLCLHWLYYHTSGILRMSNNAGNAMGFSDQIMAMMQDEKITKIYPEFNKYFIGNKCKLLDRTTSEEWKMTGLDPRIRASHFAKGRDAGINSIRVFVALIIDDLSDGFTQMNNDEAHQDMTRKYYVDMESRQESEDLPVFILGTMFNEYDIQNTMISSLESAGLLSRYPKFKNTRVTPDFSTIVITVDCFNEKGESVAPKLISTKKLEERRNNLKPYEFDLVYRQIRSSREPRIFEYDNLKQYTELPKDLEDSKVAVLDPTRKSGSDFFSLPVFGFARDGHKPYFIDCIYEQKSLGKISDPTNKFFLSVIKFLMENNVKELHIENNTSNTLGTLFDEAFKQNNYYCNIIEHYQSRETGIKNKTERIIYEEPTITANIYFPSRVNNPPTHRISRFMNDFTRFDSKNNTARSKQHDDAPDTVAMFSKYCLFNKTNRLSEIYSGISLRNLWKK